MAASSAPTTDIGSPEIWYGQVLPDFWENTADLLFPESVITYSRMRHDPELKAVLNAYMLPILRATWLIDPAGCRDEVVQHVADDLGVNILGADAKPGAARRRGVIWQRHLRAALHGQLVYGFMPFERRYLIDPSGAAHLDDLGPRMPWTVARIETNRDGSISAMVQNTQPQPLPANRLLWYVNDLEGANWTGISMMRACFGAWILKHETWRVHATSIRRFGMGVPMVEAPTGATNAQIQQARQLASAMRGSDTAGMAVPAGFKPSILGMTGSAPDALAFIQYLDRVMAKQALASLIELGQTETGSRALGETFMDLFLLSLQGVADEAATVATSGQGGTPGIITDIVDQNWGEDEPAPRLVCTDVGTQYEATAASIQQLTATGALEPDEGLDTWIRERFHMPVRTSPWTPPVTKGGALAPGKSGGTPSPADGGVPAAGAEPAVAAAGAGRQPRAASPLLRRQLTKIEAASGFDPEQHQAAWQTALDQLMDSYSGVAAAQKAAIMDQVETILASESVSELASINIALSAGETLLAQAMQSTWHGAVAAMLFEASKQGVHISSAKIPTPDFSGVATGRATFAANYLAQQAGSRAMRSLQPGGASKDQQSQVVTDVSAFLDGLSVRNLQDQLGGALTAAQNAGRVAVLKAAPASAGQKVTYTASEILDRNTCPACQAEDGHEFDSLADAEAAYPTGGFKDCEGDLRCRGTVVAIWGDTGAGAA